MNHAAAVPSRRDLEWDALYARHAEEPVRFVLKLVGDRELAADLVHDTLVHAMRSRTVLRDPFSARAWLYAIAANRTRSELFAGGRHGDQICGRLRTLSFGLDYAMLGGRGQ